MDQHDESKPVEHKINQESWDEILKAAEMAGLRTSPYIQVQLEIDGTREDALKIAHSISQVVGLQFKEEFLEPSSRVPGGWDLGLLRALHPTEDQSALVNRIEAEIGQGFELRYGAHFAYRGMKGVHFNWDLIRGALIEVVDLIED